MNYQTFEPGNDLSPYIRCYWTLESPAEAMPEKQTIVPDGCMEMIFHYGDLYKQYRAGSGFIQPRCFVIGQLTQPLEIEPTGETGIFSVRFHPNGFLPFATMPIKQMENTAISLEKLFGADGTEMEQNLLSAITTVERIKQVETFLLNRLTDSNTIDRMVKLTVDTIMAANGQLSVNELSRQTHISRRQLERRFSSVIGLSPKQLSKIIRLQAMIAALLSDDTANFTTLAHHNEYYDQSHFIKDFKEFTGFTPKEFYNNSLKMSSLFSGGE